MHLELLVDHDETRTLVAVAGAARVEVLLAALSLLDRIAELDDLVDEVVDDVHGLHLRVIADGAHVNLDRLEAIVDALQVEVHFVAVHRVDFWREEVVLEQVDARVQFVALFLHLLRVLAEGLDLAVNVVEDGEEVFSGICEGELVRLWFLWV
jgi:hypothetical protein